MTTKIKICGIQNIADAQLCEKIGVDAIGLVFYEPSPRHVEISQAKDIANNLAPFITVVALFVNPTVEYVNQVLDSVKVDCLQFHGEETDVFCNQFNRKWFKAIRVKTGLDLISEINKYPNSHAILLDSYDAKYAGGTGKKFAWQDIPENIGMPLILAGGLNVNNIQSAIEMVKPWSIDISGGVESSLGIKSPELIIDLVSRIK